MNPAVLGLRSVLDWRVGPAVEEVSTAFWECEIPREDVEELLRLSDELAGLGRLLRTYAGRLQGPPAKPEGDEGQ